MGINFMEAGTEIDGVITKYEQCLNKIASLVASACISRAAKGNINDGLKTDVLNLIKSLPVEDQNKILIQVILELSKAISSPKKPESNKKENKSNGIFSNRGF